MRKSVFSSPLCLSSAVRILEKAFEVSVTAARKHVSPGVLLPVSWPIASTRREATPMEQLDSVGNRLSQNGSGDDDDEDYDDDE